MSPARRKQKRIRKKNRTSSSSASKFMFVVFLIFAVIFLFRFTTKFWSKDSTLSVVFPQKSGDIEIASFNPSDNSISTLVVPGETQVRVARQLGTWRIKSVWKLGENEKVVGKLLAETVTREFNVPVYAWADSTFQGFTKSDPISIIKAASFIYKTNLGLGDKAKLAFFSFGIKNFKRSEINLKDTRFLTKNLLVDGEEGYRLTSDLPTSILAEFYDAILSKGNAKIKIIDDTGNSGVAESVGKISEVVGLKVASIQKEQSSQTDCLISGSNKYAVKKLSLLFSCVEKDLGESNFDVIMKLGTDFSKRY